MSLATILACEQARPFQPEPVHRLQLYQLLAVSSYSPTAQISPVKPDGHTHWKMSSDSKFGMHEAFLGHGPVEHEFYKRTQNEICYHENLVDKKKI